MSTDFFVSFLRVMTRGVDGEPYNVGDDRDEISMRDLAERIRVVTAAKGRVIVRPSEEADYLVDNPQRRCPDLTKLRALGGNMPCGVAGGRNRPLCALARRGVRDELRCFRW